MTIVSFADVMVQQGFQDSCDEFEGHLAVD